MTLPTSSCSHGFQLELVFLVNLGIRCFRYKSQLLRVIERRCEYADLHDNQKTNRPKDWSVDWVFVSQPSYLCFDWREHLICRYFCSFRVYSRKSVPMTLY